MSEKKTPDQANGSEPSEKDNHSGTFQQQLDVFMEEEEALFLQDEAVDEDILQEHLDHFIEDIDHQIAAEKPAEFDDELSHLDPFSDEAFPASNQQPHSDEDASGDGNSGYGTLIIRALAATALIVVVVVWFVWPTGPVMPPEYADTIEVADVIDERELSSEPMMPDQPEAESLQTDNQPVETVEPEQVAQMVAPPHPEAAAAPEPETGIEDDVVLPESSDRTMQVSVNRANVRSQPLAGTSVVAKLTLGTPVLVIAEEGEWFQIRMSSKTGWIHDSVVKALPKPSTALPADAKALRVAVDIGNFRRDPHPKSQVLYKLKQGSRVMRVGREGDWYRVRLDNGVEVWAHHSILEE